MLVHGHAECTDTVDPPSMRIDPEHTGNADPTIATVRWDITVVLFIRVNVGVWCRL